MDQWVGDEATLVPSAILGYRAWKIVDTDWRGPRLCSLLFGVAWPAEAPLVGLHVGRWPPEVPSEKNPEHRVPMPGCVCGIYAWQTREQLTDLPQQLKDNARTMPPGLVCGVVRLWGRVVRHECGWRAEQAEPVALYDTRRLPLYLLRAVARRYGLELLTDDFDPLYQPRTRAFFTGKWLRRLRGEKP